MGLFTDDLIGLRVISNLHCNNKCNFCYQQNKSATILDLDTLLCELNNVPYKHFNYCTIMGGESTLLPNLVEYIKIGSLYAKETRLTTNGTVLTPRLFRAYRNAGLSGINISIATIRHYQKVHGSACDIDKILDMIDYMTEFGNMVDPFDVRVNIPLCKENMSPVSELIELLDYFTKDNIGITICEDIVGSYSLYDHFDRIGATVKEETNYGLILLDYKGHQIGYYTHRNSSYNDTDLVVTPLGTFRNWDGYCGAVGFNEPVFEESDQWGKGVY